MKTSLQGRRVAITGGARDTGVHISAICPGFVRTELIAGMSAPGPLERFVVVDPEAVAKAVVREIEKGRSRTVFVPKLVGGVSRGSLMVPTSVRDAGFRASGGDQVTSGLDKDARAAYQARVEGRTD